MQTKTDYFHIKYTNIIYKRSQESGLDRFPMKPFGQAKINLVNNNTKYKDCINLYAQTFNKMNYVNNLVRKRTSAYVRMWSSDLIFPASVTSCEEKFSA